MYVLVAAESAIAATCLTRMGMRVLTTLYPQYFHRISLVLDGDLSEVVPNYCYQELEPPILTEAQRLRLYMEGDDILGLTGPLMRRPGGWSNPPAVPASGAHVDLKDRAGADADLELDDDEAEAPISVDAGEPAPARKLVWTCIYTEEDERAAERDMLKPLMGVTFFSGLLIGALHAWSGGGFIGVTVHTILGSMLWFYLGLLSLGVGALALRGYRMNNPVQVGPVGKSDTYTIVDLMSDAGDAAYAWSAPRTIRLWNSGNARLRPVLARLSAQGWALVVRKYRSWTTSKSSNEVPENPTDQSEQK